MTVAATIPMPRRIDIIVSTYNRSVLLAHTLASLKRATVPDGLDARFIIVDNNSHAPEAARNTALVEALDDPRFRLIVETRQGLSFARNAGIAASDAEWIGFVDDDEQVDPSWLVVANAHLQPEHIGFISGPYLPDWETPPPAWLPANAGRYIAVIGWIDLTRTVKEFNRELDATAMGGNVVIKRRWFDLVGLYDTGLGRVKGRLLSSEDHDMHNRLIAAGARGFYVPDLIIHHFIPSTRLTKKYHRRWAFWHGFSMQHLEQRGSPHGMPVLFGMPRYLVGNVLRSLPRLLGSVLTGGARSPQAFTLELDLIEVLGRLYAQLSRAPVQVVSRTVPASTQ